ncbi:MAG: HAD-IC family P-type ATPase, partial [Chloroflexota bacterium]|nr:HAD-IC family P-type ATPase [Chloroflexota bacterium]
MSETVQQWHALSAEEALRVLQTDAAQGLTSAEAQRRQATYGYNELQERPPITFWQRLWDQLKGFVVVILWISAIVSALLGDWVEAAAIMLIVVLNAIIGVVQESKAEEALAALKKMAAPEAHVLRDGHRITIPARELVPGDVVLLEAGNVIPADVRLLASFNLKVEEASLTGESLPVNKDAGRVLAPDTGIGDCRNSAFMSTMVSYGRGKGLVISTGMQTEIGKIAEMIQAVEDEQTPLQKKLDDLGRTLGIGSLAICGVVFLVGILRPLFIGVPFSMELVSDFFLIAVSLAIAAVPEGLPAVVTICLALGMR